MRVRNGCKCKQDGRCGGLDAEMAHWCLPSRCEMTPVWGRYFTQPLSNRRATARSSLFRTLFGPLDCDAATAIGAKMSGLPDCPRLEKRSSLNSKGDYRVRKTRRPDPEKRTESSEARFGRRSSDRYGRPNLPARISSNKIRQPGGPAADRIGACLMRPGTRDDDVASFRLDFCRRRIQHLFFQREILFAPAVFRERILELTELRGLNELESGHGSPPAVIRPDHLS